MVRNYAAIKPPGGTEVPIDKTNGEGALELRNGGTSAAKLNRVKSGKPRHLVFTQERRVPD